MASKFRSKPLSQQTIVITGASSGIGLATARLASQRGARVVLVSRNEEELRGIVQELRGRGGRAEYAVADVADKGALEAAAAKAREAFGGFDAWVNDAGISVVGEIERVSLEDHRRVFETNYWGVVHGSMIAVREFKAHGGTLVNVGSILSDRSIMLQGPYSATKFAVKAFTDALRMELEKDGAPVNVTLVKPAGIDTPFQEHARNLTGEPGIKVPPPAYDPRLVARAVLFACENQRREIFVGGSGYAISLFGRLFPRLTDLVMEATGFAAQTSDRAPRRERADSLHRTKEGGTERSLTRPVSPVRQTSLLLEAQMRPVATMAALAGLGALAVGALAARRMGHGRVSYHSMR